MSEEIKIALITAAAGILGALHLPKLYEYVFSIFSDNRNKKVKNKRKDSQKLKQYKDTVKHQEEEINNLKNEINSITIHLNVIIPILKDKFSDDKKTVFLLDQLINNIPKRN